MSFWFWLTQEEAAEKCEKKRVAEEEERTIKAQSWGAAQLVEGELFPHLGMIQWVIVSQGCY